MRLRSLPFPFRLPQPLDGLQRWQCFCIIVTLVIEQLLVSIWMYYVKSVNWCACCCYAYLLLPRADARFLRTKRGSCNAVRDLLNSGPDGGSCPPGYNLPCRGFTGECGDITSQFSSIPVLPDYTHGLADWNCHAFPDDDKPLDSFLVGLISVACAIPVTWFMQSCFEIANDR